MISTTPTTPADQQPGHPFASVATDDAIRTEPKALRAPERDQRATNLRVCLCRARFGYTAAADLHRALQTGATPSFLTREDAELIEARARLIELVIDSFTLDEVFAAAGRLTDADRRHMTVADLRDRIEARLMGQFDQHEIEVPTAGGGWATVPRQALLSCAPGRFSEVRIERKYRDAELVTLAIPHQLLRDDETGQVLLVPCERRLTY